MKPVLYYLLQVIVASGILYGYYHLALRNKKFHRYNRFYLLASTVVSITIPFLNIPVYFSESETNSSVVLQTLTTFSISGNNVVMDIPVAETNWFNIQNVTLLFYSLIASLVLLRILLSLFKIRRIIKNNVVEKLNRIHFINTTQPGTPFSFFRWLFWNKKIELKSEKGEQIFRHELFHIHQKHSWDIMYFELLTVVFWINPFFHLMKKETKVIHEFLADQFAVTENSKWEYAELLLMQVLNTQQHLVNPFFHNQIKRRITMLTTSKKPSYHYVRKLMVFPVAAIVIGLFAFTYKEKNSGKELISSIHIHKVDTIKDSSVNKIIWIEGFFFPEKKSPASEKLKIWSDSKMYAVWLDDKRVNNSELSKYKSSDFSLYNVIKLEKNADDYNKYFFQVNLWTNKWYEKSKKNIASSSSKYHIIKDTSKPLLANRFDKALIVIDGTVREEIKANEIDKVLKSNDIESITVLKDGDAAAKYGTKGENGVVEIVTKKNTTYKTVQIDIYPDENKTGKADKIFTKVEIEPSFAGGEEAFARYIAYNQKRFKISLKDSNIVKSVGSSTAEVQVKFLVDLDGSVSDITTSSSDAIGLGNNAIELINKGPKWIPAIQNGHKVKAYKNQAVKFLIEVIPGNTVNVFAETKH